MFRKSLLFIALSISTIVRSVSAEPLQIGILTDLTGKGAYLGQHARIGAELAAAEINQNGTKLKLVFGDHGMDPAKAVTEAQKLINVDNVAALYSTFSGTSRAAAPIAQSARKLFVYAAAAVSPIANNPIAFKSYLNFESGCAAIAAKWKREGVTSVGILRADSEFGELCERGALAVYPQLEIQSYKMGERVNTQALVLKSKGMEGVFNAGLEGDMSTMLKAFEQIDYYPRIGANEDIFTDQIRDGFSAFTPKVTMFGMPQPVASFIEQVRRRSPDHVAHSFDSAGMAYLHVKQLYLTLTSCAGQGIECEVNTFRKSPPDERFGFEGWSDTRQAIFRANVGAIR